MRNIFTVASREYKAYFGGFIAYLFAFSVFGVVGFVTVISLIISLNSFGQQPPPDVTVVTGPIMFLLVFACPAFTMRLLSDEIRQGTIEILMTAPVRDWEVVVGKWLGSFLAVATVFATTLIFPIALNLLVSPGIEQGPLITGYLGLLLTAGAFLAIGIAVSSFSGNQVISYLVTFGVLVVFWWIFGMVSQAGSSAIFRFLDLSSQFYDNLYRGVIDLSGVVYFLSLIVVFLALGSVSVEARRWR